VKNQELIGQIVEEIEKIPCVNSHSHLPQEDVRLGNIPDALAFLGHAYPASDLSSAGMSDRDKQRAFDRDRDIVERWRIIEPYWPHVRHTGFVESVLIAFKKFFGISELNERTLEPLSESIRAASKPGYYHRILREVCNISFTVPQMTELEVVDRSLFVPMPRLNRFSMVENRSQIEEIERLYQVEIRSLADLVRTIEEVCAAWKSEQVAGVKLSQSYFRRMDFHKRRPEDARVVFNRILAGEEVTLAGEAGTLLDDYLVFECCRAASEVDLTIQFHLGMRAGTYNTLEGCSPYPMVELLGAFPEARFDLSHSGFPYLHESGVLAKGWANIFLNMDWIQTISPVGSRRALLEWLRMVPTNKIIAFGDDVEHVEVTYGTLVIARRNVAEVLAELIQDGTYTESMAIDTARAIFRDNPSRLYGMTV